MVRGIANHLVQELREILKTRQNSDCVYRDFLAYAVAALQPRKYYKGLVRSIVGIVPAVANARIKEITEQIVWVKRTRVQRFQHACTLKFSKAFQFIAGQSAKKVNDVLSLYRGSSAKKCTNQGRARGDNGQIKLQLNVR